MDNKSLEMLEFPQIKELLAGFTSFSASRELALDLQPLHHPERIMKLLGQSAEARALLTQESGFSLGGISDIRDVVRTAALAMTLDPPTLLDVKQTLSALREAHASLKEISADFPLLWKIARDITPLPQIEQDITSCIDPSGEVLDTASPQLASIRQQLREMREQLLSRLEGIVHSPRWHRFLQDTFITERDGRYVIPVKIESRHEIKGIIHDISNTAATAFLEPTSTVGIGNALRELVIAERNEIERILGNLTAEVDACCEEITINIELAAELDLALAKGRFGLQMKCAEPEIKPLHDGQDKTVRFVAARHPLLREKAVPFSAEIGRDFSVLLITGPNTGGKTVTLKTIGLLTAMAQSGLPIPASPETTIPVTDSIFADIGDEQSIEQTLSTFSWHMSNIVRIINTATGKSLVLLDELGTSTDPAEGSALARAILHHFLSRSILTIATTHYGDLKAFAYATPGMQNASLEFDPASLKPTYQLVMGLPGGSNALATASRLGLPDQIIDEAKKMLATGSQELEELLTSLTEERQKTGALREELNTERENLQQQNEALASERNRLKSAEHRILQEARGKIVQESALLQKQLRQASAELRKEKTEARLRQARETAVAVRAQIDSESWQPRLEDAETAAEEEPIRAGDTVWLKDASLFATVVSVTEATSQAEVRAGNTKITLDLNALVKTKKPAAQAIPKFAVEYRPMGRRRVSLELDLRGKRADEVEPLLDSYLNDAVQANLDDVRIIHGVGTGTVRQITRDFLSTHPLVRSFHSGKPDEGGDGATVVSL
ncbi:endonuclease MutS2 [Chloroflexota bacterium]